MTAVVPRAGGQLFSNVSGLRPAGTGRFEAEIDPGWTIRGKPNGGYLLSLLGRAATWPEPRPADGAAGHDHVIAATATYLFAPEPGPVLVTAEPLRTGRSASQIRARMEQDGRPCVEALLTAAHLEPGTQPYWDRGLPRRSPLRPEDCDRLVPVLPTGDRVSLLDQVELHLEPGSAGFLTGRPAGRGELRGWLALPGDEPFDPVSLLFAVDAFPPGTFDIEFAGWVPTLELTVYVRALPAAGPVQVLQRAQLVEGGRVDEACFVWDSAGRLVAQSTQLAGIRLGGAP